MKKREQGRRRKSSLGSLAVTPMAGVLRTLLIASVLAIALVQARLYVEAHGTILPAAESNDAAVVEPPSEARPAVIRVRLGKDRPRLGERIISALASRVKNDEVAR